MAIEPVDEFILDDSLNEAASFLHIGGSPIAIKVIFDERNEDVQSGGDRYTMPVLEARARTTDLASVAVNDTLTVNSVTYYITGIYPDGTGLTRLMLSKEGV